VISLSSGLLQFVSSAYLITPGSTGTSATIDQAHVQLGELVDQQQGISSGQSASSTASAQLAQDTYTPSSQNSQSDTTYYSQADAWAASTGVSKTTMEAMFNASTHFEDPVHSSWNSLSKDLASGDMSAAQNDYAQFSQSLTADLPYLNMSSLTAPSAAFMSDLDSLGKALSAGNLTDAKAAFTSGNYQDLPTDLATAGGLALGQAEIDGGMTAQGIQNAAKNNTSFTVNSRQLAEDIKNIDDLNREGVALTTDLLVGKGFSASDAAAFATASYSISNGSSAENAATDTLRAAAWVNALTNYAQNGSTAAIFNSESKGDIWHQEGQSNPMFACITGIEYASSISAWNEAHAVTETLGTNSTNSSGNADGKSSSSVSVSA
jgi:hypothetical protein